MQGRQYNKRTLTGYSVCRTFWRGLWHGHPGLLVHQIYAAIFIGCLLATALLLNSIYLHGKQYTPHCPSSLPARTNHPPPSTQSLTFLQHKSFGQIDLPASLYNFTSRAYSLFPHRLPGTHCLHRSALSTNCQPSNVNYSLTSSSPLLPHSHPVPAPQIRFTILALYKLVCMYVLNFNTTLASVYIYAMQFQ